MKDAINFLFIIVILFACSNEITGQKEDKEKEGENNGAVEEIGLTGILELKNKSGSSYGTGWTLRFYLEGDNEPIVTVLVRKSFEHEWFEPNWVDIFEKKNKELIIIIINDIYTDLTDYTYWIVIRQ